MKKRKKFDEGGVVDKAYDLLTGKDTRSVMEKPARNDMTDAQYRRERTRAQALETSAPESMLMGPARGAQLALTRSPKELAKRAIAYGASSGVRGVEGQILDNALKNELRGGASVKDYYNFDEDRKERRKNKKMKSGGTASSRGDGIATKGKTRGRMV
jgi:hypothetical protein